MAAPIANAGRSVGKKTQKVDTNIRRWIGEMLLSGISEDAAIDAVQKQGFPITVARVEVRKALNSPYLTAGYRLSARVAKRTWHLNTLAKLWRMSPEAKGIGSISHTDLTPQTFFTHFYAANRPLLIKGMVASWPAMEKWSLDYFQERLTNNKVEVQFGRSTQSDYEAGSNTLKKVMDFGEWVNLLRKGETTNDYYLTANNGGTNGKTLAPLWDDIEDLQGYLTPLKGQGFLWMGPKGTLTPFHHDLTNNFLVQISGRKRVVLAHGLETERMRNHKHVYSEWHVHPEKAKAMPEGQRPHFLECVLEPGDVLFIPVGWWHFVEGLDMTFGMSFTNFVVDNNFTTFYSTYQGV